MKKGTENQFTAIIKDKEGNVISDKVIWEISVDLNTVSFLKQENNAWITPKKAGTFTVTASCGDILETIICTVEE